MGEVDPVKDFYDSEVQQYTAVEEYAGPFNSAYYMGSGFDRTPAETLEAQVLHADHDPEAVGFLERQGYHAVQEDITEYNPEKVFELIILSHLPTQNPPLVMENLETDGTVICRNRNKAREINEVTSLNLQAVYEGSQELVEQENFETSENTEMYLFQ